LFQSWFVSCLKFFSIGFYLNFALLQWSGMSFGTLEISVQGTIQFLGDHGLSLVRLRLQNNEIWYILEYNQILQWNAQFEPCQLQKLPQSHAQNQSNASTKSFANCIKKEKKSMRNNSNLGF
jgi:hypothetical protein